MDDGEQWKEGAQEYQAPGKPDRDSDDVPRVPTVIFGDPWRNAQESSPALAHWLPLS
jgi:hypothetical protein